MTTGAVWLIVFSLVLFIWASGLAWAFGILDDAFLDPTARFVLGLLYLITWVVPTLVAVASWWHYS